MASLSPAAAAARAAPSLPSRPSEETGERLVPLGLSQRRGEASFSAAWGFAQSLADSPPPEGPEESSGGG